MKRFVFIIALLACGHPLFADNQCLENFNVQQDRYGKNTYKTRADFYSMDAAIAFDRVYKYLASDGWQISSADRQTGVISAVQTVGGNSGKTTPLNVLVENVQRGCNISITYVTSPGLYSPADEVAKAFCKIMASATSY